jgi:ABC-type multidrug transport system ATPase subunit
LDAIAGGFAVEAQSGSGREVVSVKGAGMTMQTALEFKGIRKRYRKRVALDGLDLSVPAGSIFGLVGSNGAGKTTSLLIATGIIRPQAGTVRIFGQNGFDPLRHRGRVSLLPQDSALPSHAAVETLLLYYARLQGISPVDAPGQVARALGQCRLSDRAKSPVRTLSHGMRRRVHLAQAFLGNPELVLLDEPLSGLDPREVANIREILIQMKGRQTIVISSHNLAEIERMCDHLAFIEHGRTVHHGDMDTVTKKQNILHFRIRGEVPLDALRRDLPEILLELDGSDRQEWRLLTCRFAADRDAPESITRVVLTRLLEADVAILEITRGAGLENAYLGMNTEK